MPQQLELDPLFDTSFNGRMRRTLKSAMESRYVLIAVLIHILALLIFGGKVIYEAYTRVNVVEQGSLVAPTTNTTPPPPPPPSNEQTFEVKVTAPQTSQLASKLAVDRLSSDFNVAAPEIQSVVSASMSGMAGGSGNGVPGGTGFASVSFFGVQSQVSSVVFVIDISGSMKGGKKIGNDYKNVEREVSKVVHGLSEANSFNIVTFARMGYPFKKDILPATLINKDDALRWYFKQNPENFEQDASFGGIPKYHSGTAADKGLEAAFRMKPGMIMFVSDGVPSGMKPDEVIDYTRKLQISHGPGIIINTVFYKTGNSAKNETAKKFMEELARNNGGKFKSIE